MITNQDMDHVFAALAHQTRREILDYLRAEPGLSVGKLASRFDVSRVAIMNHLAVLEAANLVVSQREGRTRQLYINVVPLQMIYERWTDVYSGTFAARLTNIKQAVEAAVKTGGNSD